MHESQLVNKLRTSRGVKEAIPPMFPRPVPVLSPLVSDGSLDVDSSYPPSSCKPSLPSDVLVVAWKMAEVGILHAHQKESHYIRCSIGSIYAVVYVIIIT